MGRPPKKIDWELVHRLASYQCTQQEVAAECGVDVTTLENKCLEEFGISFSVFWSQKKSLGRVKIRKVQMALAEQGNAAAAIWLGKQYLNQTDRPVDELLLESIAKAGISRDEAINLILNASKVAKQQGKKSFEEFATAAGYPKPFAKQIEMMQFGMHENVPRLLLGSRGYGKTDYVVILGIAYDIYVNPHDSTNLIITKSKTRNAAMIQEIANALIANSVVLEKQNSSVIRVHGLIGKDHSVEAITIRTSLRGRHPKRTVMDDPVTEEDTSEAVRSLVKKKYNEIMKLTQNVLIIGQPAHAYDLYADLRPLVKKMEVPHGTIPELDHDLEAQRLAGVDEKSIQASYFLKIVSDGGNPFDKIKYVDKFPVGDGAVAFIDPSHEGGDYTAISIIKGYMQGVAVVGFAYKKAWNHCLDDIAPRLKQFNVKKLCFETNALGDQPVDMLRQVFPGLGIVGRRTNNNKHSRIMAAGAYAHLIHLSKESDRQYTDQVVKYEYKSKNDDAPDSLASCLEWVGLLKGKV